MRCELCLWKMGAHPSRYLIIPFSNSNYLKDYPEMAIRSGRLVMTVVKIVKNFGDMKKLSPEAYKDQMPEFHVRTAQMLYDMCCELLKNKIVRY